MKKRFNLFALASVSLILIGAGCNQPPIASFEECVAAGNPVMESYPRQCRAGEKNFVEKITPPAPPLNIVEFNEPFTLEIGQNRPVLGGLRVTLLGIDDSRCPKDVQCIWAGELAAHLQVEGPEDTAPVQEIMLGTVRNKTAEVEGFRFELKEATETFVTLVVTR